MPLPVSRSELQISRLGLWRSTSSKPSSSVVAAPTTARRIGSAKQRQARVKRSPQQATTRWVLKNCAVASTASLKARDSSRSSIPKHSDNHLLAAFGWLSCRAIATTIPTNNATNAVGIALTPQSPGLGGIGHLHRFGLQLALALKDQVVNRGHRKQWRASLLSPNSRRITSLSWGRNRSETIPQTRES